MEIQGNWIKIHRDLKKWEWRDSAKHFSLFIHLLLNANYKESKWRGRTIFAGQLLTGTKQLGEWTGLSRQSVRTILKNLKSTNEITIETTNRFSIITITNWDKYQQPNQQPNQQTTNKQPTTNHIQEVKEVKEVKNIREDANSQFAVDKKSKMFKVPSIQEIRSYIKEKRFTFNADSFINYYESNGWKIGKNSMKDWKAACRTWQTRENKDKPKKKGVNLKEKINGVY